MAKGGNEEWAKLGAKKREPEPPVKLRLRPEDVLGQRGSATDTRETIGRRRFS